jgi:hypothetical protein
MRRRDLTILLILGALLSGAGCGKHEEIKVRHVAKGEPQGPQPSPTPKLEPQQATAVTDTPPASWMKSSGDPLRLLSYQIVDEASAQGAGVSLVMLGGGAGGILENVNRWRAQIGLKPLDERALTSESQRLATRLGEATVVDMSGKPEKGDASKDGRIIAVILPFGDRTFFFKLRGNPDLAGRRKQEFLKWIDTVRIPQ